MAEPIWKENSENPELLRRQREIAIRALETISERIEALHRGFPSDKVSIYTRHLFQLPSIKGFLEERDISENDEPEELKEKLRVLIQDLKTESKRIIVSPPELEKPAIKPSVPETDYESEMSVLDQLNKLQKELNEHETLLQSETQRVTEALARFDVFASDISESANVQVVRTEDGTVEVLFLQDVREAETLQSEAEDIRNSEERIRVYEVENEKLPKKKNRWSLWGSRTQESEPELTEWEGKIMRTQEELGMKVKSYDARYKRLELRIANKRSALEVPLQVTGLDTYTGDWANLRDRLKEGSREYLRNLSAVADKMDKQLRSFEKEIETSKK